MENGRRQSRDLGITLLAAAALLLVVGYLTQCSPAAPRTPPVVEAVPTQPRVVSPAEEEERRSGRESRDEQGDEERAKIRNVAHALQTIGASPQLRATLGLPK